MKRLGIVLLCLVLGAPVMLPVHAQPAAPWLQVWMLKNTDGQLVVEYRDATGMARAAYPLAADTFNWPQQAGGRLFSMSLDNIQVFDPYVGRITTYPTAVEGLSTEADIYGLRSIAPRPDGRAYAYGVMLYHADWEQPATSYTYLATVGTGDDRVVHQQMTESVQSIEPFAWSEDGSLLVLHTMPVGIGGYILFWTYQDVLTYNLSTGVQTPLGNVDGLSRDGRVVARLNFGGGSSPVGLTTVQDNATIRDYPLPPLDEQPLNGGEAVFSPSGGQIAYQVARVNPEQEKFWTIVVDVASGQSRVVMADEATGYDLRFGYIGGWLDDATLVIGSRPEATSAVIDVTSGALLREEPGVFMGYATGIGDTTGFAPSSAAFMQCPGAPVSRLQPNQRGRVTYTDGTQTNVRQAPGLSAAAIGTIPEGSTFTVLAGPICADGYAWWNVQFDRGLIGFVAEGDASAYYLELWP